MKNLLLGLALLISFFSYSQIPMLEVGNTWSVDINHCPFNPPNFPTWTITEQISIGNTETINALVYTQVIKDGNITCLLREENGIVYKYFPNENSEKILFNYNLEVGDTFSLLGSAYSSPYCSGIGTNVLIFTLEVFEIENINIAGLNRKVLKFIDNNFPQGGEVLQWIEGIGSISGFDNTWEMQDITCSSNLVCFTKNSEIYYFNDATSCDNTTLSIGEQFKNQIILYPNPVTERSVLQLPIEAEIDQIKIYNISGQLVKTENISSNNFSLNSMNFANGLYFYQVFSKDELLKTEQFIVK